MLILEVKALSQNFYQIVVKKNLVENVTDIHNLNVMYKYQQSCYWIYFVLETFITKTKFRISDKLQN